MRVSRLKAEGSICIACLQEFWSHERLVCHREESSSKCRHVYAYTVPNKPVEDMDEEVGGAVEVG